MRMPKTLPLTVTVAAFLLAAVCLAEPLQNDECLACHDDKISTKTFGASVHGPLQCTDCHADITAVPHQMPPRAVECGACHTEAVEAWNNSLHAKAVKTGTARGARCVDCHGPAHDILPSSDRKSRTYRATIPQTCARCHAQKFIIGKADLSTQAAISYQESVHGRAAARGSTKVAVCIDCHDSHFVRRGNDPQSGIFKFNVARTCGKCHSAIAAQFGEGVHGKALARGNWSSPTCTDCHGVHAIARAADPIRGPRGSCAHCHEAVRLTEEFGVSANRVSTYQSSYHGLASRMGLRAAADCSSCHGAHDILRSSDPRSAIHRNNLTKTCGKCHPGVQANFARGKVHFVAGEITDLPSRINTWIRWIYTAAIVLTIGFMLLHNLLVWWRKAQARRRSPDRTVVRMTLNQRAQHIILFTSFTVLVVSGFALAWPDSFFSGLFFGDLRLHLGGSSEPLRRLVHRVAAVIIMALGVYHIAYITFTAEGRKMLRDIWLRFSDGSDLIAVLRYYLGRSSQKPTFGRFSYAEKAEYWAGMWGTIVMAVTGVVIWYAVAVATWIPRWWIDIATTIHFYEAILATLAIVVWHFYHVIFDPDVYPMNWAWFDGKMSEEQNREEHGREAEKAEGKPSE